MKVINRYLNKCPRCGSFDTNLAQEDYTHIMGKLNGILEARNCDDCKFEWWNVYALVQQYDNNGKDLAE